MSDSTAESRRLEALRAARQGLLAVRLLCAVSFTAGGLFLASLESAYQAFAPLDREIHRIRMESLDHPERPEAQLRAGIAEGFKSLVRWPARFTDNSCLWASGLLTGLGVVGMCIGNRLGFVIARLKIGEATEGVAMPGHE